MVAPGTDADEAAASIGAFLQLTYTPTCLSRWSRDPPRAQRSFAFFFFFFFDFFFDFFGIFASSSSTSKTRVAFEGIVGGLPASP